MKTTFNFLNYTDQKSLENHGKREAIDSMNKDREFAQSCLNWICLESSKYIDLIPNWVYLAACSSFEKKYFLPSGYLNATNFQAMTLRGETITVDQIIEKLTDSWI